LKKKKEVSVNNTKYTPGIRGERGGGGGNIYILIKGKNH